MRIYLPTADEIFEPTKDPDWWRAVNLCEEGCGHPVHAFGRPERLRHIERTVVIKAEGVAPMSRYPRRPRSVKVEDSLWDAAKAKAADRDEVLSEVIREALKRYVARK